MLNTGLPSSIPVIRAGKTLYRPRARFLKLTVGTMLLSALLLLISVPYAGAEETLVAAKNTIDVSQIGIGSNVPNMRTLAAKVIKGLAYTIGFFLVMITLYKRLSQSRQSPTSPIHIVGRQQIGPKNSLLLVEVEGRKLLLAATADEVKLLTQLESAAEFSTTLEDLLQQKSPEVENKELPRAIHG